MRWPRQRIEEEEGDVAEHESSPELDRVRRLAQKAAELGAQVEAELRTHITEGHPRGT